MFVVLEKQHNEKRRHWQLAVADPAINGGPHDDGDYVLDLAGTDWLDGHGGGLRLALSPDEARKVRQLLEDFLAGKE